MSHSLDEKLLCAEARRPRAILMSQLTQPKARPAPSFTILFQSLSKPRLCSLRRSVKAQQRGQTREFHLFSDTLCISRLSSQTLKSSQQEFYHSIAVTVRNVTPREGLLANSCYKHLSGSGHLGVTHQEAAPKSSLASVCHTPAPNKIHLSSLS